ncbi:hypothetical protein CBS101457_001316 [Exobasidium rhododendri]|nr:hypothetical protein CBS101457_001316 [Exobasidium rhododendri]
MQLSFSILALALTLGTTLFVDAAPIDLARGLLHLELSPPNNDPLLATGVQDDLTGARASVNLCKDPTGLLVKCKDFGPSKPQTKPHYTPTPQSKPQVKAKAKPQAKPQAKSQAKPYTKPHPVPRPESAKHFKPQRKPKGEGKPKTAKVLKPQVLQEQPSVTEVGGNALSGNGGNAAGGSADCSTGNSLLGLSALNFNSCNGGAGQQSL